MTEQRAKRGPGRTDTKIVIFLVGWSCAMVTYLVVWLTQQGIKQPAIRQFWPYIGAVVAAILGPSGVGLTAVALRKAIESGGLGFAGGWFNRFSHTQTTSQANSCVTSDTVTAEDTTATAAETTAETASADEEGEVEDP
jgi:hypothetical protein